MQKPWLLLLAICLQASDLRISEVMSNPQGSEYENEFVEIYNAGIDVIHIKNWILTDGTGIDSLDIWLGRDELRPGQYGLILDPGYDLSGGIYLGLIPDSIPIYTISTDASFGSGGLANAGESITVHSPDSTCTSHMVWSSATENGYSWERVDLGQPDSSADWEQSRWINGTPGTRNSVSPAQFNLSLSSIGVVTAHTGMALELSARIINTGLSSIDYFQIQVHEDMDQDSLPDSGEWSKTYSFPHHFDSQEVFDVTLMLPVLTPGIHVYVLQIILDGDALPDDNMKTLAIAGSYPQHAVTINEIMASPSSDQGGEWIEIMNHYSEDVSLQGWTLSDANSTRHLLSNDPISLAKDGLFILYANTAVLEVFNLNDAETLRPQSWPTLNGGSDSVRLYDAAGNPIDCVFYRGSWGVPGKSLERRHPLAASLLENNWRPSLHPDGATPLTVNTQLLPRSGIKIDDIQISPFHLEGPSDVDCLIRFSNQGLDPIHSLVIQYGPSTEWHGEVSSFETDSVSFTFMDIPPGFSTPRINILQSDTVLIDTQITLLLGFPQELLTLNEIHYLPTPEQSEFLEYVNLSTEPLNMQGWRIGDKSGTFGSLNLPVLLEPATYLVLCEDISLLDDLIPPDALSLEISPWPSLNNSSDSVFLFDPLGQIHVRHGYENAQGGQLGVSLERKALWRPSDDHENWASSPDFQGMTPGQLNAATIPPVNLVLDQIQVLDSLLYEQSSFDVRIFLQNAGQDNVEQVDLVISLVQQGAVLNTQANQCFALTPNEIRPVDFRLHSPRGGWTQIRAFIDLAADMNPGDNVRDTSVYIACDVPPVLITELYPLPLDGEAEWVEILNRSQSPIDLLAWRMVDRSGMVVSLSDSELVLREQEYLVFYDPSGLPPANSTLFHAVPLSLPILNNSSDEMMLLDPLGQMADHMSYDETLIQAGRSIERIRLDQQTEAAGNWGICVSARGATPGEENSLNLTQLAQHLILEISPNPFSPDGDGQGDELIIGFTLPVQQATLVVWVFDMAGRRIARPVAGKAVGHLGQVSWNGRLETGGRASTGVYILKVMVEDGVGGVWNKLAKVYLSN
jgi:hypothetical protein